MVPTKSIRSLLPLLASVFWAVLTAGPAPAHEVLAGLPEASPAVLAGTVEELVIDNRVDGTVVQLHSLRQDDGSVVALSGPGAASLQKDSRVEVSGNLRGAALEVTGYSVLAAVSPAAKAAVGPEQKVVQGTLVVWHKDYFAEGQGEYGYGVYTAAAQVVPLNVTASPDMLRPGISVSVSGTIASDGVSLEASEVAILALAPANANPAGVPITNNVLVLPIKFSDSATADPFTPAQIDQVMRTNANSTAAFYNEVSYGQQALNITVACQTTKPSGCAANTDAGGWLVSSSATPANCDFNSIGTLADAAATAAGYDIASYYNRFYVLQSTAGCGWAGLAYIGFPYQAWSNGYNALWVYGHELGHNFTLYHAGSVNCGTQVLGGSCSVAEYGDRFDVMGNNSSANQQMHFNAAQKSLLGWIPPSSVATHTSGTKTYTLSPLEAGGQSSYAVKIPVSTDPLRTYWIEFRQPIGFDAALASYPNLGAIIHVSSPFDYPCSSCGGDDTEILDMTPSNGGNFYDSALLVGQKYTDSTYGVSVTVNSASANALSVTVAVAGGSPTTTTPKSSADPSALGATVTFTATVTGSTPTGTVAFASGGAAIAGCTAVPVVTTTTGGGHKSVAVVTYTAACSTNALTQGEHSIVASYSGDSTNAGSSSAPLTQTVSKAASTTALATSLSPSAVGKSVTFTATVSGAAPTGSVNFLDGSTSVAGCGAVALTGSGNVRTAQCATAALAIGTHSMTASYGGDGNNAGSTSAVLSQVVTQTGGGGHHH